MAFFSRLVGFARWVRGYGVRCLLADLWLDRPCFLLADLIAVWRSC